MFCGGENPRQTPPPEGEQKIVPNSNKDVSESGILQRDMAVAAAVNSAAIMTYLPSCGGGVETLGPKGTGPPIHYCEPTDDHPANEEPPARVNVALKVKRHRLKADALLPPGTLPRTATSR